MSPPKSMEINGPRPSPLLIHKDSRLISKPQLRQPIIIYTHSPKIIHTQPKDFMALVQRLTGFTPPIAAAQDDTVKIKPLSWSETNLNDNDCSSVLTDDNDNDSSFLSDVPLFTPRSSSTPFSSPGLVNSLSPSFMEFLKGLPDF